LWLSSSPPGKYPGTASTRPRPPPSKSCPIHQWGHARR